MLSGVELLSRCVRVFTTVCGVCVCAITVCMYGLCLDAHTGTVTSAVVADLDMDALYYFKLRAVTGRGAGPPSQVLEVQTKGTGIGKASDGHNPGSHQGRYHTPPIT